MWGVPGADGAGKQPLGMGEQESVRELTAAGMAEDEELLCVDTGIALSHILNHVEQYLVIGDTVAAQ